MKPSPNPSASALRRGMLVALAVLALGVAPAANADIVDTGANITAFLDYDGGAVNLFPVPTQPFDPLGTSWTALNPDAGVNSITLNMPSTFEAPSTPPATILANSIEVVIDIDALTTVAPFTVDVTGLLFDGGTEELVGLSSFGGTGSISGWSAEATWSFVDASSVLFTYVGGTIISGGSYGETAKFVTEAVPEPASLALVLGGLIALPWRRCRQS